MKKIIAVLILAGFMATLLAGCGGKDASSTEDDTSKEVQLLWYTVGDKPKDYDKVMAEVNKYTKEKINATVEIKFITWADYEKKMTATASAGEAFDLCFTSYWTFDYRRYARQGFFYPMDELLAKYGEGITKSADVMPKMLEAERIKGEIFGIPVINAPYQSGYYLNRKIVDKYNFDYSKVTKIEDMFPLYAKIKADHPSMICIADLKDYNADDKFDWIMSAGFPGAVRVSDNECKVINQFEDPEYVAILQGRRAANLKGYTYKDTVNVNKDNDYKAGRLAGFVGTYTVGSEANINATGDNPPTKVFPTYPRPTADTRNAAMGAMVAMGVGSKNPARAMKFINMLYSDAKLYNMLNYGIEGVHYKKVGDNTIEFLPAHKDYTPMPDWTYGNKNICYIPKGEPADKWTSAKKSWDDVVWSPIFGFIVDLSPVQNEISAMTNVAKEYENVLQAGSRDIEPMLKEYLAKMKDAGMDKYMAEMQKQIDEWKKTKK